MAWNKNLDVDKPPDTGESPSLGASRIRDLKNAICERLTNWIYSFKADDSETDEGLKKAPFKAQGTAPTEEAGKIIVYAKDVGGIAELFVKDKNGVEIQITTNGKINMDHGNLAGLTDDDHTQYYNSARHTKAVHDALAIDHGSLTGLGDDDHTNLLNNARHDLAARHPIAVIAAGTRISVGSYTGNGTADREISLNFNPQAIFLTDETSGSTKVYLRITGMSGDYAYSMGSSTLILAYIVEGTSKFTVGGPAGSVSNVNGTTYRYIAIKESN